MNRDHMSFRKRRAMLLLDLLRAGMHIEPSRVTWALIVTGDLLEIR